MILSLLTGSTPPLPHIPIPPKDPPAIVQKAEVKHKIIKGDTLTRIAKEKNTTVERLFNKNTQLTNPDVLIVGIEITIPEPSEKLESRIPPVVAEKPSEPIKNASSTGLNGYAYPSCTGHVALKRYVPPGLGNAYSWLANAQARGMATGSTPRPGAIGWRGNHVVFVESVHGDTITISENNYDFAGSTRTIDRPSDYYTYIY